LPEAREEIIAGILARGQAGAGAKQKLLREKPAAKITRIFLYFILLYGILSNAMSIKYKSGIIY